MDLNRDLEKNERMTFLIWCMIVSPCAQYKRKNVQNTQILTSRSNCFHRDYIFFWEYVMQPERFIPMVQTQFQQFVLTGAWNWPRCHQSNFFLPITWLLSRNAHFSQSSELTMNKISSLDLLFFLGEWKRIFIHARLHKILCKCQFMLILKASIV